MSMSKRHWLDGILGVACLFVIGLISSAGVGFAQVNPLLAPPSKPISPVSSASIRQADIQQQYNQRNQLSDISWGPAVNMSNSPGSLEPTAALHPTNPLLALSGGNSATSIINNTTDGGLTWQHRPDPNSGSGGDAAALWLTSDPNTALFMSLDCCTHFLNLSKTTDAGATWSAFGNVTTPGFSYDRPYIWIDQNPASSFYGRLYATTALFNTAGYFTVGSQWSSDGGISWSPFLAWVDPYEYSRMENADQFASLAAEPDGTVVGAWLRGMCCHDTPEINVPNKIMWTRSTDGGASFPLSGTITTVPIDRSMSINSHSPSGFKWNAAPNIATDPVDGTLYAVWVAYRQASQPASAAVYLARGTSDGTNWTAPTLVYDNPNPALFQYMPWVQVSREHTVHISFGATVVNTSTLAEYYVQSTDRGQTFSTPFMLSTHTFTPAGFMGDYQAASVGGYTANQGAILVTWTENASGTDQWGRIGTFSLIAPTPTATFTATITPTSTAVPSNTPTALASPTGPIPTATNTAPANTPTFTYTPLPPTGTPASATPSNTPLAVTATPTDCPNVFVDVTGNVFYGAIHYLACRSVLSGTDATHYSPSGTSTRGQFAKVAVLGFGLPSYTPSAGQDFSDVPPDYFAYVYIESGFHAGILSGFDAATCRAHNLDTPCYLPNLAITRGQLTKLIVGAAHYPLITPIGGQQDFTDVPPTNVFFVSIETAHAHGVINGFPDGTFRPNNNIRRDEMAQIVFKALTSPLGMTTMAITNGGQPFVTLVRVVEWSGRCPARWGSWIYPCGA